LNDAVRKILEAKYKAGLLKIPTINTDNLVDRLNSPSAKLLKHQLAEGSVTLLSNSKKSIPIAILEGKKFTSISIGKEEQNEFTKYLNKYANVKHFPLRQFSDTLERQK
jgi:beta-N-acetylhexosaminidase